jgi:hypothetical protein
VDSSRDRLKFGFLRLVEGEAEGRFAITALVVVMLVVLLVWMATKLI